MPSPSLAATAATRPGTRPVSKRRTDVWWLVGPQGSGKSRFAEAKIAEYEAKGQVAHHAAELPEAKLLLSQRDHGDSAITIRYRAPYAKVITRVQADLLMVEVQEEPGVHSRRFHSADRIVRFPLQAEPAPKKKGKVRTIREWMRARIALWMAAIAVAIVLSALPTIEDGAAAIATDKQEAPRQVAHDQKLAKVTP